MAKKKKQEQANQFVVVSRLWGVADGADRSTRDADTIGWWFRIMLKDILNTDDEDIIFPEVVYTQTTQECVIVQLHLSTDIDSIIGVHPRPASQVRPGKTHSIVYAYNFKTYGDPTKGQWTARYPTNSPISPQFPSFPSPYPSPLPYNSSILGDELLQRPRWALSLPHRLILSRSVSQSPSIPQASDGNPSKPVDPRLRTVDPRIKPQLLKEDPDKPSKSTVKHETPLGLADAVARFLAHKGGGTNTEVLAIKAEQPILPAGLAAALVEREARRSSTADTDQWPGVRPKPEPDTAMEVLANAFAEFQAQKANLASKQEVLKPDPESRALKEHLDKAFAAFQARQANLSFEPESRAPTDLHVHTAAKQRALRPDTASLDDYIKPDPDSTVSQELLERAIAEFDAQQASSSSQNSNVKPDPESSVPPELLAQAIAEFNARQPLKSEDQGDTALKTANSLYREQQALVKREPGLTQDILTATADFQARQRYSATKEELHSVPSKRPKQESEDNLVYTLYANDHSKRLKKEH